ncbi:carboxylesterase/lipase family protein [Patulibacter sp.]|uniref:carboxylesterase/lipase family protein n=1 Tax=Patulibacter sp. TaxID=1912859 RepID=UPI002716B6B8|nr:carboxylesterase family protein [Patulibacter sp.]MDO9409785.1 carboxylesterase family protein [Patulibacter sp.]
MNDSAVGLPVVTTRAGALRGVVADGVASFKGIPYAAPPTGPLRFAEPAPVPAWDGVRDASAYGPTPPKPRYLPPFDTMLSDPIIPGEGVLNLNVWTPAPRVAGGSDGAGDGPLPVLVWIHGGAFRGGTGAVGVYDGSAFARDGVVCVTINYRLGMDGFGLLPDAPHNRGLLDQIAALRWVRDEIAAFGGDPGRVTIAGESAGAMSAVTLLASPEASGLFHGVIAQSGAGHHVQSVQSATRVAEELGRRLGVEPTAAGFATVPIDDFIAAQLQLGTEVSTTDRLGWGEVGLDGMAYEPVVDGRVVPRRPIDALADASGEDAVTDDRVPAVPVLIGANSQEYRFWLAPLGMLDQVTADALPFAGDAYRLPAESAAVYADAPTPGDGLEALISDWFFRIPAIRVAEARWGGPAATHVYEFRWGSPQLDGTLGAAHAVEIAFAFDTTRVESGWGMIGPDAPEALAAEMHAAWVAFARDGDPGWPAYEPRRRAVRVFGGPEGEGAVEDDPHGPRREVWDGLR